MRSVYLFPSILKNIDSFNLKKLSKSETLLKSLFSVASLCNKIDNI